MQYTVNIYRYKVIWANATSSVILYTGKCVSPCPVAPIRNPLAPIGLPIGAQGFPAAG